MTNDNGLDYLPRDAAHATLVGRVWRPAPIDGPSVVAVRNGVVFDITAAVPTMADLLDQPDPAAVARTAPGESLGPVGPLLQGSIRHGGADAAAHPAAMTLLAPCDVQAIKACGVTFAVSLLERLIEERTGGDAGAAQAMRATLQETLGTDLRAIKPGSESALRLKETLIGRGAWSQYMEVGIGTDAEVFSKSQPMSAVGFGAEVGLLPASEWNNPEPEIVLAVNSRGETVGATLGNDVNLRDIEGRSALLLGKAKDNNGSCAIGPFIRLFDAHYGIDDVRNDSVSLLIEGKDDGFVLNGVSHMREISRDPLELVAQTYGRHHQYPDGFMLFLGTMFSPIQDRGTPGSGFTHKSGDRVTIASPGLGKLINTVEKCTEIPPWTFGVRKLYANLARRGLLR
ncbi:fumarylacetoacetate hydrolase family protein [Bordetella bronchialis]|uniref:Fumarylacetoacetate hydrolase n=1 Tax=Bordetella bronchialis TaxID=463025 RepID=A0A193FX76_9BORD|nr:fumarylacetoacetate hydrolase family protein [Bordetella bronchialis]ANN67278.1 fumarylacetoacetate hydrolase [Bordetella bronchialis]ANN72367.1 fumarylacetoacetate hydrolase [Bordetella bronchialis]